MMDEYKKAAEILETMTEEPEPGHEARLDADELDAVLMAIRVLTGDASTIRNTTRAMSQRTVFMNLPPFLWGGGLRLRDLLCGYIIAEKMPRVN